MTVTKTIMPSSKNSPNCMERLRSLSGRGLFKTPSMAMKKTCPPSNTGMGSRLSTPNCKDKKAKINKNSPRPDW